MLYYLFLTIFLTHLVWIVTLAQRLILGFVMTALNFVLLYILFKPRSSWCNTFLMTLTLLLRLRSSWCNTLSYAFLTLFGGSFWSNALSYAILLLGGSLWTLLMLFRGSSWGYNVSNALLLLLRGSSWTIIMFFKGSPWSYTLCNALMILDTLVVTFICF